MDSSDSAAFRGPSECFIFELNPQYCTQVVKCSSLIEAANVVLADIFVIV